MSTYENL